MWKNLKVISCSPQWQLPFRTLLNLMNTFQTQFRGIWSTQTQETITTTKPRVTEELGWSHLDVNYEWSVPIRVHHGLLPEEVIWARVWRWQKGNECQVDKRWIAVRFHKALWTGRTVAQKLKCGQLYWHAFKGNEYKLHLEDDQWTTKWQLQLKKRNCWPLLTIH